MIIRTRNMTLAIWFAFILLLAGSLFAENLDPCEWQLLRKGQITSQQTRPVSDLQTDEGFNTCLVSWAPVSSLGFEFTAKESKCWIAVGLMEPYWNETGKRIQVVHVEGTSPSKVDLVKEADGQNRPFVLVLPCEDVNHDKKIKINITAAAESEDKNVVLNKIWLFSNENKPESELILKGLLNDKADAMTDFSNMVFEAHNLNNVKKVDGRLMFGNGYFLGCFVGPFEKPETPSTKVHDKISRLWMGYSSPQMSQIGLGVTIVEEKTGQKWTVGACDEYCFKDGVIRVKTHLSIGEVETETFGLWEQPVLIRHITFTPSKDDNSKYHIQTKMQLYKDYDNTPPENPELLRVFEQAYPDKREVPPSLVFHEDEKISVNKDRRSVSWSYNNPYYRKAVVGIIEKDSQIEIAGDENEIKNNNHHWIGEKAGGLDIKNEFSTGMQSLTVVITYGSSEEEAKKIWSQLTADSVKASPVKESWQKWFETGAVVETGNTDLDQAYRNEMMYYKISQDAELGGMIVGGRYQITTVWTRDSGVGISAMLDAGHYQECRRGLEFYAKHAAWNVRNDCLHANYHASGKVLSCICGPAQVSLEEVVQPFKRGMPAEWGLQMVGPQLDGMAYFLYNIGKYERYTGDMEFVRNIWPFIMQVAHSLAADNTIHAEVPVENGFFDKYKYYKKYNPETGLIIDMCCEDGGFREHILMNGLAVAGFREVYRLSEKMGEPVTLWKTRAEQLDNSIRKYLVKEDNEGRKYFLEWVTRDWLMDGKEIALGPRGLGYPLTIASVVPYLNWRDPVYKSTFELKVPQDAKVAGWGMWYATLAHAAFEAGQSRIGWHYLKQVVNNLPPSKLMYEHNSFVTDEDGTMRLGMLCLYGYAYLPHAVIRGFAGIGFDENRREYFFRPQIPDEFGAVKSKVKIGSTIFDVTSMGNGETVESFVIDGHDYTSNQGIMPIALIDGKRHSVEIKMQVLYN